jgi:YesN/AraC family two-component response regulator
MPSTGRRAVFVELPSVLVVEDDTQVRCFIRSALEDMANVVDASDGEQAVRLLAEKAGRNLDLVLVDHVIPEPSGLEIVRLVSRRWSWIPVVMMTGFGSESLVIQALRAGARDYLRKPIELEELLRTVSTLTRPRADGGPTGEPRVAQPRDSGLEPPRAVHRGVRQALDFLSTHFTEAITLSQMAREASLTKFHFCRLFHQETGHSFREYLQVVRVRQAIVLLADRGLTVTEIAYAVGFNDLSHFYKVFRRITGLPPSEFRKALRSS